MAAVALSIIVPTCGRATLARTLASIDEQLERGDEVIVVGDGEQPRARDIAADMGAGDGTWWYDETPRSGCYGNAQRDWGIEVAMGTHLLFMDDDDEYLPGALDVVRAATAEAPDAAHVFRMRFGPGHPVWHARGPDYTLWVEPAVRPQNVGTPMVALPCRPGRLPRWSEGDGAGVYSDFAFLRRALARFGPPVWHEDVIAVVRP